MTLRAEAEALLRRLTGSDEAEFRDGQWAAIESLVERRGRALVVQRTGWGKSAVYFVATRLLRDRGAGPTILVSPLLALMRNQIAAAERAGVHAVTINSENRDDWSAIEDRVRAGEVDLLLISPERLNNPRFRRDVLPDLLRTVGLVVVDEAHCISDWGHDFRPDYRRIGRILDQLQPGIPVLCTTATANDRVVADVVEQLGSDIEVVRGPLERESLSLAVLDLPDPAHRLAWLARAIPELPGSGIVYCLTIADAERVARWLNRNGIDAAAYSGAGDHDERVRTEDKLLANDVKVVVATSALGMGFDKPDLTFVIHYQAPGSAVAYYQQVGRAGRAIDRSYGWLLRGGEDADIQDWFIRTAFPSRDQAEGVIALLDERGVAVKQGEIEVAVNVGHSRLEGMLKVLDVEGAVERSESGWQRTKAEWAYPADRVERVTALRRHEQEAMRGYARTDGCRMAFLRGELDDPMAQPCGRCDRCTGTPLDPSVPQALVAEASAFLRSARLDVEPRKRWPNGLGEPKGVIGPDVRLEEGRALSVAGDGGWGSSVRAARSTGQPVSDELVEAAAALVRAWDPEPAPGWVTCVPSSSPVVADAAERLAVALGLPFHDVLAHRGEKRPQAEMENSAQQVGNVYRAFKITGYAPETPVLLVDDLVDTRWTLTAAGMVLRVGGSGPVLPLALATARGD
ncbi:MAG: ATP-dependent helicase, RecQ-like [Actinomycetia bacterium]|nr:ATP-dependent helicase, RecQ-like [Actinomycetes bacterium]